MIHDFGQNVKAKIAGQPDFLSEKERFSPLLFKTVSQSSRCAQRTAIFFGRKIVRFFASSFHDHAALFELLHHQVEIRLDVDGGTGGLDGVGHVL